MISPLYTLRDATDLAKASPEFTLAHDAWETNDPRKMDLLVGLPATIHIGSDRYAAKVVRVTAKTIVVSRHEGDTDGQVFRFTKRGWQAGRSYRLTVGYAEDYRDPSF